MNTPRSKPRPRYSPKITNMKDGLYAPSVQDKALLLDLGFFLTTWPHIEEPMVAVFADLTGIANLSSARLVFRSIINQNTRIAIMRAMLAKAPQHAERGPHLDELIDEYGRLNRLRNTYAHGLWYTHQERNTQTVYLEAETDTYDQFLNKRVVPHAEIKTAIKEMGALRDKLWTEMREFRQRNQT